MITRRLFSSGLLMAPAVIRIPGLLMPIKSAKPFWVMPVIIEPGDWTHATPEQILADMRMLVSDAAGFGYVIKYDADGWYQVRETVTVKRSCVTVDASRLAEPTKPGEVDFTKVRNAAGWV